MGNKTTAWVIFKALDKVSPRVNAMSKGITKMMSNIRHQTKYAVRELRVLDRQLNKISSGFMRRMPGIGLLSGAGIVFGAKEAIETAARLESMETAIRFVSGSAEEGQKNMDFLRATTKDLGIDVEIASEGFKRLLASSKSTESMDTIRKNFEGIGIASRVMGLDVESQGRVIWALSEMYSKGTVMAQELKLQLGNALPGAFELMAKTAGVSTEKLIKIMQKGGLKSKEIVTKFITVLRKEYEDGLWGARQTTSFALAGISISWKYMVADVGNTLADTGILTHIQKIVDIVAEWVKANKKLIGVKIKEWIDKFISFGKWIVDNWGAIWSAMKSITAAFIAFKAVMIGMNLVMLFSNPLTAAAAVIAAMIISLPFLIDYIKELRDSTSEAGIEFNAFESILLGLSNTFDGLIDLFSVDIFGGLRQSIAGIAQLILGVIQALADAISYLNIFNAFGDNPMSGFFSGASNDLGNWSKGLDEWAAGGNYDTGIAQSKSDSGYDAADENRKRKISPYSTGPSGEGGSTVTHENVLYIKGAKAEMGESYLKNTGFVNGSRIVLSNSDNIPYER